MAAGTASGSGHPRTARGGCSPQGCPPGSRTAGLGAILGVGHWPCTALPATPIVCQLSPHQEGSGALVQGCSSPSPLAQLRSCKPVPSICAKSTCVVSINGTFMSFFTSSGSDNTGGSATSLCPYPRHVPMLTRRAGLCLPLLTYTTAWIQPIPRCLLC